jgi:hypothetical protein
MGQVMAHDLTSPVFMSKLYFPYLLGYKLNLQEPATLNEKLQWLKLNYWPNCREAIQCADKYAVRTYVESVGKKELLNDILFAWDRADEIDWDKLPDQFVLKCNHGCGYNILCPDKSKLDEFETKKKLHKWMREDFSKFNAEPHYGKIQRKIVCEKYLGSNVINYNIYCFNGKAVFFSVAGGLGDGVGEHLTYYYTDGTKADFKNRDYPTAENKLSAILSEMVNTAEYLAKDFPMVRVDLFDVDGRIVLSEMTFTPGGALIPFEPVSADRMLGEKLDIGGVMEQYAGK